MADKILCRFFAVGTCNRGAACQYSHDLNSHSNNVCSFFLRGMCQFGDRCRYEHTNPTTAAVVPPPPPAFQDWVAVARPSAAHDASGPAGPSVPSIAAAAAASGPAVDLNFSSHGTGDDVDENEQIMDEMEEWLASQEETEWWITQEPDENRGLARNLPQVTPASGSLQEMALCGVFTTTGRCPKGSTCTKLHGERCPFCERRCLHPFRKEESAAHVKSCERNQKMLEVLRSSQEVECCVCLEKVLSKPVAAERKFGIMSHCDHPFCIACIRGWRQGGRDMRMDVDTVVRACPVCRVQSHFITPSPLWFFTPGEKVEIIDGYKKKLKSIDCKYFSFGEGRCQFGTSCFYRHAYRDGSLEQVKLRHLGGAEGSVIAREVKLSDFLSRLSVSADNGHPGPRAGQGGHVQATN